MSRLNSTSMARDFAVLFATGTLANLSDGQLLDQFISHGNEHSFRELIARHGPLVLSICRRSLDDAHDIEDAFQAIFLILVRKAGSLRDRNALSSWLYGVALRVVRRVRKNAMRRRDREQPIAAEPEARAHAGRESMDDEVFAIVDLEIRRLPTNQQAAVILCLLEGYTHEAAATQLGWPLGTVKSRIATARQTLTRRLTQRGVSPSAMAAILRPGLGLPEPGSLVSAHLREIVVEAAAKLRAGSAVLATALPTPSSGLVHEALGMTLASRMPAAVILMMTLTAVALTVPTLLMLVRPGRRRKPLLRQGQPHPRQSHQFSRQQRIVTATLYRPTPPCTWAPSATVTNRSSTTSPIRPMVRSSSPMMATSDSSSGTRKPV